MTENMNLFNIFVLLFILTQNFSLKAAETVASSKLQINSADFYYIWANEEFIDKRYNNAADLFYLTLINQPNPKISNTTLLYLALSQYILGDKKKASYNASFVDEKKLNDTDLRRFKKLKINLGAYFDKAVQDKIIAERTQNEFNILFTPYFGQTSYSTNSTRDSANFFGAFGFISKGTLSFSLGSEYFDLKFKDGSSSYNQTQFGTSITKFLPSSSFSLRYTQITSPNEAQTGIKVYGAGTSIFTSDYSKLNLDFFHSQYPNYSLGKMMVNQFTTSFDYGFDFHPNFDVWFRVGHLFIKPNARDISNGTSFVDDKYYQRTFFDLNMKVFKLILTGSYWMGMEVFGVRNDGNLVFSGLEEHLGGFSSAGTFEFDTDTKVQLTYMKENINVDSVKSSSSAIIGTLIKTF
jgi:hypothetical protein